MGLNYPAGPEIDRLAKKGKSDAFQFPIPKVEGLDVSFSGLKTAFINLVHKNKNINPNFIKENLNDLCASIQKTFVVVIINKIILAKEKYNLNRLLLVAESQPIQKLDRFWWIRSYMINGRCFYLLSNILQITQQ